MTKRRSPGDGAIFQRGNGRWVGTLEVGYEAGHRTRRYVYGRTRAEVKARLADLVAELEGGSLRAERLTVRSFLDRWLDDVIATSVRPSTARRYRGIVETHLAPALGHHELRKMTAQHVESAFTALRRRGVTPATLYHVRSVLRTALAQALRWSLVSRNVATLTEAPRVDRPEIRPLDREQVRQLLEHVRGDRLEALYALAVATGLRQGELLGLTWGAVDLDAAELRVRLAMQVVDGRLQLVEPKTARSRRTIALPAGSVVALRDHRRRQLEERLSAGPGWHDQDLAFCTPDGRALDGTAVTKVFQRHVAAAGLPRIRFHDLRHTAASLMLAQGVAPRVVMETLGHSTIAVTMNTYSHVVPEQSRDAARRMDEALSR